jgi:Taurine catabolism dioxygenase TauD, TfdA family.
MKPWLVGNILLSFVSFNLYSCPLDEDTSKKIEKPVRIHEYKLSNIATQSFKSLCATSTLDPYINPIECTKAAKEWIEASFPKEILESIQGMHSLQGADVIILHQFPIDDFIPETPRNGCRPIRPTSLNGSSQSKGYVSEYALLGLCGYLGANPTFDEDEKDGTPINQIIPVKDQRYILTPSSLGSKINFLPHTENVYQDPPLKFFELLALRGDPKVTTTVIPLASIMGYIKKHYTPEIYAWVTQQIQLNQFVMSTGPSFEGRIIQKQLPILSLEGKDFIFRLNLNEGRTIGINNEAQKVIIFLKEITENKGFLNTLTTRFILKQGDLLLFNNWRVMHARDAFEIDENNWRWLQRVYCQI